MNAKRKIVYVILIAVLAGLYAWRYLGSDARSREAVAAEDLGGQSERLRDELAVLHDQLADQDRRSVRLRRQARKCWRNEPRKPAATAIQRRLIELGRQHGVEFKYVGAPRTGDLGSTLQSVDIVINLTDDVEKVSGFIAALEGNQPRLEWLQCTVQPSNNVNPKTVVLNGTVRAYVLTDAAAAYLDEHGGS